TRSADDARASERGLDSGLVEEAVGHFAGHADAGVLAGLPEVVLSALERRRGSADSRDSGLPDDVPRWAEPEDERGGEDGEQQLTAPARSIPEANTNVKTRLERGAFS